jgi:outer membrane protein assembly factor BamD
MTTPSPLLAPAHAGSPRPWACPRAVAFGLSAALVIGAASACATGQSSRARDVGEDWDGQVEEDTLSRARTESSVAVVYAKTPQDNFARGEIEFGEENYLAAQKFYTFIRTKFPYSGLATRAELRIADCLYARQRWLEAIDAYQAFARAHPSHEAVGYAAYRIGAAYYEQIPSDWFLMPPSYEKDQATLKDAARALRAYVERYPKDTNQADGQKLLDEVRRRLVAHERSVADFYLTIDRPASAVLRLETIKREYAELAVDEALLADIADLWTRAERRERAERALAELETKYPRSERLTALRARIQALPKPEGAERVEDVAPAPSEAAPSEAAPSEAAPSEAAPSEAAPADATPSPDDAPSEDTPRGRAG